MNRITDLTKFIFQNITSALLLGLSTIVIVAIAALRIIFEKRTN